ALLEVCGNLAIRGTSPQPVYQPAISHLAKTLQQPPHLPIAQPQTAGRFDLQQMPLLDFVQNLQSLPLFRAQLDPLLFHRAPRPLEKRTFLLCTNRTFSCCSYTIADHLALDDVACYLLSRFRTSLRGNDDENPRNLRILLHDSIRRFARRRGAIGSTGATATGEARGGGAGQRRKASAAHRKVVRDAPFRENRRADDQLHGDDRNLCDQGRRGRSESELLLRRLRERWRRGPGDSARGVLLQRRSGLGVALRPHGLRAEA